MTREEVKQALTNGKKVTHTHFLSGEYIYQQGVMIFTEEGYKIDQETFWRDRAGVGFNDGWEIYSDDVIVNPETERFIENFSNIPQSFMELTNNVMTKPYLDYGDNKSSIPSKSKRAQLRKKRKKRKRGKK